MGRRRLPPGRGGEPGVVYVVDDNRVQKFTPNGGFMAAWTSYAPGNGQFNGPLGIAAGPGNLYVADTVSNRILVFRVPSQTTTGALELLLLD